LKKESILIQAEELIKFVYAGKKEEHSKTEQGESKQKEKNFFGPFQRFDR